MQRLPAVPQFSTVRRNSAADRNRRKLRLGSQPPDESYTHEEEKQASKEEDVVQGSHSRLLFKFHLFRHGILTLFLIISDGISRALEE